MRDALGIDKSIDILDHVHGLPEKEEAEAQAKLQKIERAAMVNMEAQPGLVELMTFLEKQGVKKSICTRNFPIPVQHLRTKFLGEFVLEPIVTREFKPPKPHPAGILHIAKSWGIQPRNLIMVGDSVDDMAAGYRAGAATILLQSDVNTHLNDSQETDIVVKRLDDIIDLVQNGFDIEDGNRGEGQ